MIERTISSDHCTINHQPSSIQYHLPSSNMTTTHHHHHITNIIIAVINNKVSITTSTTIYYLPIYSRLPTFPESPCVALHCRTSSMARPREGSEWELCMTN